MLGDGTVQGVYVIIVIRFDGFGSVLDLLVGHGGMFGDKWRTYKALRIAVLKIIESLVLLWHLNLLFFLQGRLEFLRVGV